MILATVFIPESPKWYYARKNYDKARANLRMVSKFNSKGEDTFEGT